MRRILRQIVAMVFAGLAFCGAADVALAQVDRVILVTVGPAGETTVRCTGMECETVDCSGNGQLMASGDAYFIRRDDPNSCSTQPATPEAEEELDRAGQEIDDTILAFSESPGEVEDAEDGGAEVLDNTTSNQNQATDTGESDGDSATPTELQ